MLDKVIQRKRDPGFPASYNFKVPKFYLNLSKGYLFSVMWRQINNFTDTWRALFSFNHAFLILKIILRSNNTIHIDQTYKIPLSITHLAPYIIQHTRHKKHVELNDRWELQKWKHPYEYVQKLGCTFRSEFRRIPELRGNSGEFDRNVVTIQRWSSGHFFPVKSGLLRSVKRGCFRPNLRS